MKILEVCPDEFGFRQYANDLVMAGQGPHELLPPLFFSQQRTKEDVKALVKEIEALAPDLIHIQHEFGFLGSKVPGRYQFPFLVRELKRALPRAKLVATAHSVITQDFRYPVQGRGWQAPFRALANVLLMPFLRRLWIQKSWGGLDGVIVHSRLQLPAIEASGCPRSVCIPHYVPNRYEKKAEKKLDVLRHISQDNPILFVFGYFTPEKGQDVVIRAMASVSKRCHLILAGGVRREADQGYYEHCKGLIDSLGLKDRVSITGFLSWSELDDLCKRATLALLPFRETSGSGSLADLMSRGTPILASDLPLNREIDERVSGSMAYFHSDDTEDCARRIDELLGDREQLEKLRLRAAAYREKYSPENIMRAHLDFFEKL